MFKHVLALIILSVAVTLFMTYTQQAVELLLTVHEWVSQLLSDVFSSGNAGSIARGLIALLSVPLIIGLIPALIYYAIRRDFFPYFMEIVWIVWLIQAGALVVKAVV